MDSSATEVERLLQAARLHLAQGDLEEAVGQATEAIRLDGKEYAAYLVRADAYRRLKKVERALADLAVAIRLDPNQPGPYVVRAEILKRRNMFDQAIADSTHALTLDPRNAAAFSIRAQCRSAIGDREGSTEDIHEMLVIDPTRPIPDLRAGSSSAESVTKMASEDERFWKESGGTATDGDRSAFADGTTIDKTYRSRRLVRDEDAPEVLGVASGYKPGVIGTPIPRFRGENRRSTGHGGGVALLIVGLVVVAACAFWLVFRTTNEPSTRSRTQQPAQIAHSNVEGAPPDSSHALFAEQAKPPSNNVVKNEPKTNLPGIPAPKLNLLPSLDPTNNSTGGRWESIEGGLVSPEGGSVIKIPYHPPNEYRLTVRLLKGSKQMVGIGLVAPPSNVLITIDSYPDGGCFSKFDVDVVERRGIVFHKGSRVLPMFEMSTVVCTVRKGSITVEANGKQIGRWDGDFGRLAVHPEWSYGGKGLFIASVGKGTVIRGIELEPLPKVAGNKVGAKTADSLKTETGPVKLRIAISEEGECRVLVGRRITDETEQPGDGMAPITTSYANSFVGDHPAASEATGSSRFKPRVPQFARSSSMLVFPRAFRLPCVLTMDIAELKDGSVGVQFLTPATNFVVYMESEDALRESTKVVAIASGNDRPGPDPASGTAPKRLKVEQRVSLAEPEEIRFKLPISPEQLGELYSIDTVLRSRPGLANP